MGSNSKLFKLHDRITILVDFHTESDKFLMGEFEVRGQFDKVFNDSYLVFDSGFDRFHKLICNFGSGIKVGLVLVLVLEGRRRAYD